MSRPAYELWQDQQTAFLDAWCRAINLSGQPHLFGVNTANGLQGMAPKVREINRALPTMPKSQAALVAAMVSFYNPEEGARLMTKTGVSGLGSLAHCMPGTARLVLSDLIYNYQGW